MEILVPAPLEAHYLEDPIDRSQPLVFQWPATATRVQFTVQFSANGYSGSTTLTLFR